MEQIISSSVLIVAVILIRIIFRKRVSQKLVYALWMLVAIKLLVPINVDNSFNLMNAFQKESNSIELTNNELTQQILTPQNIQLQQNKVSKYTNTPWKEAQETAQRTVDTRAIIRTLWGAGAVITLTVLMVCNLIFLGKIRRRREFVEKFNDEIDVFETPVVDTPCLFGIVKPVIYIPDHLVEELTNEQFNMILTHEWTHYKHKDHIWSLLRCACLAVYWFNPLVWIGARLSKQDCELACDEDVINAIGQEKKKAYGRMLVEMCESLSQYRNQCILVQEFGRGNRNMKKRLLILGNKSKKMMISVVTVVIFAMAVTGCTLGNSKSNKVASDQGNEPSVISAESEVTKEEMTQVSEPETAPVSNPSEGMHNPYNFYDEDVKNACYGTSLEFMEMYLKMFNDRDQAGLAAMSKGVFNKEIQAELDSESFAWMSGTTAEYDSEAEDGSFVMKLIYSNGGSALVDVCIDVDENGKKYYYAANVPIDGEQPHANNWMEEKVNKFKFTSYDEIISSLDAGNGYAYVNVMGADEPVLFITEQTFECDGKNFAIDAYPYIKNSNGKYTCAMSLWSNSTATPISVTKDGRVICASHTTVDNYAIAKETGGFMMLSSLSVEWGDTDETNTYSGFVRSSNSFEDNGKDVEGEEAKKLFEAGFEELTDDNAINFTLVK